jgi:hypothetical protein
MRQFDIALGRCQRCLQGQAVQRAAIGWLGPLEPPAFGQGAGIHGIETVTVQQGRHLRLGHGIIAGDRQGTTVQGTGGPAVEG